jgi:predicted nucleic acid-binding protein
MIVLDTNVISEVNKPKPNAAALEWLSASKPDELFLCDVTIMELAYGAEKHLLKNGSNRYHTALDDLLQIQFRDRILRWVPNTGVIAGHLRARREMSGHMMTIQDAQIAAICLSHGAVLATRNVKDFEGLDLPLVNPFEEP